MEDEARSPSSVGETGDSGEKGDRVLDTDTLHAKVHEAALQADVEEDEPDIHHHNDHTLQYVAAQDDNTLGDEADTAAAAGGPADTAPPEDSDGMQVDNDQSTQGDIEQASVEECSGSSRHEDAAEGENGEEEEEGEGRQKKVVIMETGLYSRIEYLDVISVDEPQVDLPPDVGYRMNHAKRGVAVIFNNGTFSSLLDLPDRVGYKEDGALLKEGFLTVGFDVRYYQDLTVQNMVTVLSLVIMEGHEDADCIAVVFMTHGLQQPGTTNDVIFGKDGPLWIHNIVAKFNGEGCPSLAGKPKLFFVEASRGTQVDTGVKADTEADAARRKKIIPLEADILLSQSTVAGYTSFPTDSNGSVYIRSLARTLSEYGNTQDIHWLLTRVNFLVSEHFESTSVNKAINRKRQMPVYSSTLTKVLSFPQPLKQDTEFFL